jgi:hypothetical protein
MRCCWGGECCAPSPSRPSKLGALRGHRGTGKAAGATGTGESHFAGSFLQFGCKGGCPGPFGGFGQSTFTPDSTLTLPSGGQD